MEREPRTRSHDGGKQQEHQRLYDRDGAHGRRQTPWEGTAHRQVPPWRTGRKRKLERRSDEAQCAKDSPGDERHSAPVLHRSRRQRLLGAARLLLRETMQRGIDRICHVDVGVRRNRHVVRFAEVTERRSGPRLPHHRDRLAVRAQAQNLP